MSSSTIRANKFLDAAERFACAGSAWDCIHSAELACQLDRSSHERARQLVRKATEQTWGTPDQASEEVERLRQFVAKLEAAVLVERDVRSSGPEPPPRTSDSSPTQSGDPVSPDLEHELTRVAAMLAGKEGQRFERARATIRALLARYGASATDGQETNDAEATDSDWPWSLGLEQETHNLGNSLYKEGRFEESIDMYDLALSISPELLETYFNRGLAYTRLGRYERAEEDITKVIELNGQLAEAWYTRGLIHEYQMDYEQAVRDYDKALEVDQDYHKASDQRKIAVSKRDRNQSTPPARSNNDDDEGVVKDFSIHRVKPDCKLAQVGDHGTIKRELRKILTYLRGGELLHEWGGELPRGVLLHGEPGVGKTHLARALAGEANVPFYAPPMSLIFDMYVGNSEKNIRNLFQAASEHEHAIIFLDEVDVITSRREESRQAHEPWHARLSACLLEEMDNLTNRNQGVVVIGATNCLEVVDPSFLRPGRFTYCIEVARPGEVGMTEILLVCLEAASLRAKRVDFLDRPLEEAVLAPRDEWLEQAFARDETGLVAVARLAVQKEMVGDDVREIVRRIIDERICAGLDGIDLGPVCVKDLRWHVQDYVMVRKT